MIGCIIRGPLACFARPESPDPMTMPCITPTAARGIISHIYYHPGVFADIRRISVLSPIRFMQFGHTHAANLPTFKPSKGVVQLPKAENFVTVETVLRDPKWLVEFVWKPHPEHPQMPFEPDKWTVIFRRRLERGEFYYPPALGKNHYRGVVELPAGNEEPIQQNRNFGSMLYGIDFRPRCPVPYVFNAKMVNGVIEVPSFFDRVFRRRRKKAS